MTIENVLICYQAKNTGQDCENFIREASEASVNFMHAQDAERRKFAGNLMLCGHAKAVAAGLLVVHMHSRQKTE